MPFRDHMRKKSRIFPFIPGIAIVFLIAFLGSSPVASFEVAPLPEQTSMIQKEEANIRKISREVKAFETKIRQASKNDDKLLEQRILLEKEEKRLLEIGLALRAVLERMNTSISRIEKSSTATQHPTSSENEKQRTKLLKEKEKINTAIRIIENVLVEIGSLKNLTSTLRRDLFGQKLFARYSLSKVLNLETAQATVHETKDLLQEIYEKVRFLFLYEFHSILVSGLLSILSGLILYFAGFYTLEHLIDKSDPEGHNCLIKRFSVAFWSTMLPSCSLLLCFQVAVHFCGSFNIVQGNMLADFNAFLNTLFVTFFVCRFMFAVLSPHAPKWQLIKIESRSAYFLIILSTFSALILGLDDILGRIGGLLNSPLPSVVLRSFIVALLVGMILVVFASLRPFRGENDERLPWPLFLRIGMYFFGAVIILGDFAGYISLAKFLSSQIVITGAWLSTGYIGFLASDAIGEEGNFGRIFIGKWLQSKYSIQNAKLDQLGLLASMIINILLALIFVPFVLLQFGFKKEELLLWLKNAFVGFEIGSFSFSPVTIIWGVIVFSIGYILTGFFRQWLDKSVFARSQIDPGLRGSIRAVVGYAGIALSFVFAFSATGLDLSSLAIIAGGLSFGIGFGFQNIVSNFVSGLILLFERPFKPGDWVTTGEFSGIVKRISVRATEILTLQNQSIILPNSEIINNAVGNWTHRSRSVRVHIPITVACDSDARKVKKNLLEITSTYPGILKTPEPLVILSGFVNNISEGTLLSFDVIFFIPDISILSSTKSEFYMLALERFKNEDIKISSKYECRKLKNNIEENE